MTMTISEQNRRVGADRTLASADAGERASSVAWLALASACLGWMFDAMDLQIFTLILFPSVRELTGATSPAAVAATGGVIVAIKLFCWGLGGIAFGLVADRIGRSVTMIVTVLIYSVFTGLSGLAQNWWQLAALQAIAGIGIGGEWAAGAALVAETWPERHRSRALQVMQMSFAFGFFIAATVNLVVGPYSWRWVLAAGAVPALVTLFIRRYVPEPERWRHARERERAAAEAAGGRDTPTATFLAIFAPGIRRHTIVGVLIAATMMIGSWGGTTLLPTWIPQLLGPEEAKFTVQRTSYAFMLMNVGALLGYLTLIWLTDAAGRRWSYFLICLGAALSTVFLFTQISTFGEFQLFTIVYGFFAIGGFGTFACYLPELFPTRIRATGQGFCWNMARLTTGVGPLVSGLLVGTFGSVPRAGVFVACIYVIGLVAIWFGPETKGVPLRD
jgi:MFS family permease